MYESLDLIKIDSSSCKEKKRNPNYCDKYWKKKLSPFLFASFSFIFCLSFAVDNSGGRMCKTSLILNLFVSLASWTLYCLSKCSLLQNTDTLSKRMMSDSVKLMDNTETIFVFDYFISINYFSRLLQINYWQDVFCCFVDFAMDL